MKRQYIAVILLIILLPVFYFLILPNFDIAQFLESLKSTNIFLFSLAVIAVLVSNSFAALRWSLLMKEVNALHSSNFSNAFGIFSLGQVAGLVVPSRVGNYTKVPMVMKLDHENGLGLGRKDHLYRYRSVRVHQLLRQPLLLVYSLKIKPSYINLPFFGSVEVLSYQK